MDLYNNEYLSNRTIRLFEGFLAPLSRGTKDVYTRELMFFVSFIKKDFLKATKNDAEKYYEELINRVAMKEISSVTMTKKIKSLSSFSAFLVSEEIFNENYFSGFALTEDEDKIKAPNQVSLESIDRLITYAKNKDDKPLLYMVVFSFKMMLRTAQILRIKTNHFKEDDDGIFLRVEDPTRYVKVPDDIYALIKNEPVCSYLISYNNERHACSNHMMHKLQKAAEDLNLPENVTFNNIRNTGISFASTNGVPIDTLSSQLGFKSERHIKRLLDTEPPKINASEYINVKLV